jgi:hypothetical protein
MVIKAEAKRKKDLNFFWVSPHKKKIQKTIVCPLKGITLENCDIQ